MKIGQYLVKLWARVGCLVFLTHGVVKVINGGGCVSVSFPPAHTVGCFTPFFFFDRRRGIIPIYDQENAQFTNLRKTETTTATTTTIVLRPLYGSTCVSRHLQNWRILLVQNFTARVLLLKAMNQCILIGEKTLEFYSTVLFIGLHCLRT